jgi:hypothetical protein
MNFLIPMILFALVFGQPMGEELIITSQKIQVRGYTSVGKFNCGFTRLGMKDTIRLNSTGDIKMLEFLIPVKSFSCGNFLLNNDFRSTLKANEYPNAVVKVYNFRRKSGKVYCGLILDLAGQRLEFPDIILEKGSQGLSTSLILDFTMLNLTPPSKFGGLIKVQNQLDLELHLGM